MASLLDRGSTPWRAARASSLLLALDEGRASGDCILAALLPLGPPPRGWWAAIEALSSGGGVHLRLPRPGDPRGLALPRGVAADAAVGMVDGMGTTWLLPQGADAWREVRLDGVHPTRVDIDQCGRDLREQIVRAAHILDASHDTSAPNGDRRRLERAVDAWVGTAEGVRGPVGRRRELATSGLRVLLALGQPSTCGTQTSDRRSAIDSRALEAAARAAVEAAYSSELARG